MGKVSYLYQKVHAKPLLWPYAVLLPMDLVPKSLLLVRSFPISPTEKLLCTSNIILCSHVHVVHVEPFSRGSAHVLQSQPQLGSNAFIHDEGDEVNILNNCIL